MTATPNPDPDEGRNRRRWSRYDVDGPFPATLITEDGRVACRIENVSLTGARVRTATPVPPPTRIRLNYGRQSAADGR